uniref:Tf2-1-like SH3-like domain-containing protein n=1 Tax=Populus alba TaxID=43335 RepID=A0A4U5QQL0_POPAL|nr:hypothetical protein D5086_0000055250 [Populus alba]
MDLTPLPLPPRPSEADLDFSEHMKYVHAEVKRRLSHSTDSYAAAANIKRKDKQFNSGDMMLVRPKPERFPPSSFTKLHARRAGPFQVTKNLGSNAYVIDLQNLTAFTTSRCHPAWCLTYLFIGFAGCSVSRGINRGARKLARTPT